MIDPDFFCSFSTPREICQEDSGTVKSQISSGTYFRTFVLLKKVLNLILYEISFCVEALEFQRRFVSRP